MTFWYVIIAGIIGVALVVIPLRSRWYMGCGFGLLGAILSGGIAFGAGWYYASHHPAPRPKHDMDFSGLGTPVIWLLVIPAVSALVGFVLGIVCAYYVYLSGALPNEPPSKPESHSPQME
jgi:hypothetical protein